MKKLGIAVVVVLGVSVFSPLVGIAQENKEEKDPLLYGLASFVLPGLGQYLNNQPSKALTHFLVALAIPVFCPVLVPDYWFIGWRICWLLQLGWHAYSAIDAYETAKGQSEGVK